MATEKQRRAVKILTENYRKPVSKAMLEAGYSESSATKPSNLTSSKSFQELLNEMIPLDRAIEKHNEALEATRVISARVTNKQADVDTDDFIEVPDHQTRLKAVELRYKAGNHLKDNVEVSFMENWVKQKEKYGV